MRYLVSHFLLEMNHLTIKPLHGQEEAMHSADYLRASKISGGQNFMGLKSVWLSK